MKFLQSRKAKFLIFLVLPLLLAPLVLELLLIALEPYVFGGFYKYDPDLGFQVRPRVLGSNAFGFDDRDYPLDKPAGTFRMLVVGDSFNWMGGRKRNYVGLLRRKFEERYGAGRVEVVNVGYPMTHTGQQLAMLRKYGMQYNPDLVCLGFFAGNDFVDADPYIKRIVLYDAYFDVDTRRERVVLGYPIVPKSRLLTVLKQTYIALKALDKSARAGAAVNPFEKPDTGTFSEQAYLDVEKFRMGICDTSRRDYDYKFDYVLGCVSAMRELVTSRGARFVAAIYPDEFQVDDALGARVFEAYGLDRKAYDLRLPQKRLGESLDAQGVARLDLLEAFRARAQKERLYLLRDSHWNDAGNALAADLLFDFLSPFADAWFEAQDARSPESP